MTTTEYIRHVKQSGWPPFERRVWQRNYYERVIRGARELAAVRRYIAGNPARWSLDRDHLSALLARMNEKE
jgi:REP element-mobilizing transposase RayT